MLRDCFSLEGSTRNGLLSSLGVDCLFVSSCAGVVLIMRRRIILIIDGWHSCLHLEFFICELFPHRLSCLHVNKNLKALAWILTQGSCSEARGKFTCDLVPGSHGCVFLSPSASSGPWRWWGSSRVSERPLCKEATLSFVGRLPPCVFICLLRAPPLPATAFETAVSGLAVRVATT